MNNISRILDSFSNLNLEDEDGEPLELTLEPALSEGELTTYEQTTGVRFPGEFRDLLMYANGMSLFGLELMSVDQQSCFRAHGIISFHNWGNGDFDCVSTSTSQYPVGAVVFMNHSPDVTVKIAESLSEWLEKAVQEIRAKGALLHPSDYRERPEQGLYQHVLDSLSGVACELNR